MISVARRVQEKIGDKADLKLIKKVISIYEKIMEENGEYVSVDDAIKSMKNSIGDMSVADKVKALRSREEITQKQLALKSGIMQQHVSEIERGQRPVGRAVAKKLAVGLNCDYRTLL